MKKLLLVAAVFVFSACGTTQHTALKTENGHPMYTMDCSGFNHRLSACMDDAQTLCAQGFSIVKNKTYTIEHPSNPDGVYKYPTRVVTIACAVNNS